MSGQKQHQHCKQKSYERCQKLLEYITTFFAIISLTHSNVLIHMAPSIVAYYAFIKIKFASHNLLFYVVNMCQKSLNFIVAFNCYKQK